MTQVLKFKRLQYVFTLWQWHNYFFTLIVELRHWIYRIRQTVKESTGLFEKYVCITLDLTFLCEKNLTIELSVVKYVASGRGHFESWYSRIDFKMDILIWKKWFLLFCFNLYNIIEDRGHDSVSNTGTLALTASWLLLTDWF